MKKIEELKRLIEKVNIEKEGTVQLNPVIELKKVRMFEKNIKFLCQKSMLSLLRK